MNKINFNQSVGFPLETDTLHEMQKCWQIFNAYGSVVADKAIISGCAISGSNTTDGFVFVSGELLEFKGGVTQSNVVVVQNAAAAEFEDGNSNEVYFERYVTFGTSVNQIPWSEFKRGFKTSEIEGALALKANLALLDTINTKITTLEQKTAVFQMGGGMVFWQKPAGLIPEGWAEVIDWKGRIPVGFDGAQSEFSALGKTGGSKNATLTIANLPPHSHVVKGYAGTTGAITASHIDAPTNGVSGDRTGETGDATQFSILNPYRVVMFIEYVGI